MGSLVWGAGSWVASRAPPTTSAISSRGFLSAPLTLPSSFFLSLDPNNFSFVNIEVFLTLDSIPEVLLLLEGLPSGVLDSCVSKSRKLIEKVQVVLQKIG